MGRVTEEVAKGMLRDAGIATPRASVAATPEMAREVARSFGGSAVLKALLPIAKKAKHGAVVVVSSPEAAEQAARRLLGQRIEGLLIDQLYVEELLDVAHEYYLAVTYDPLLRSPVVLIGAHGGVDVETAATNGVAPVCVPIHVRTGAAGLPLEEVWLSVGLATALVPDAVTLTTALIGVALDAEALLIELNPLVETARDGLAVIGALVDLDDAARRPTARAVPRSTTRAEPLGRPLTALEQAVQTADDHFPGMGGVQFVQLDGDIGFAVLGGGASLFTFDAISALGGRPANYSDISPGPGFESKLEALLLAILSQPGLRGIIHGWNILSFPRGLEAGAHLLVRMVDELDVQIPIVARICGVGEQNARKVLQDHPRVTLLPSRASLFSAAQAIVAATSSAGH